MRRTDALWLVFILFLAGMGCYELRYHPFGKMPDPSSYFRK
jgi:hypothetical protein